MRTVKIVSAGAVFALASALPTTAAPVSNGRSSLATTASPAPKSRSVLALSLSVAGGSTRTVSLKCDQDSGSHPALTQACDMLRKVGGDLSKMTYDIDMICPDEHIPHAVSAIGMWEGRFVLFAKTYDNRCEMTALTGPLFQI
jgi:hypothetical protein